MNQLFNMYIPIENYKALSDSNADTNDFNTLSIITELQEKLETYKNDFSLATTYERDGGVDISTQFEELNKYTVYGKYYQAVCNNRIYDYFVSTKDKCPSNTDYNCLLITDNINSATRYASGNVCDLVTSKSPSFSDVETAYREFSGSLQTFAGDNTDNINNILSSGTSTINNLKTQYKTCVTEMNSVLTTISGIIGPIYSAYKDYVNLEKLEAGEEVNVFSWMNCTVFGRDLNATLNIMKNHFKKDLQIIFIITLVNNGVIIAEMILITFIVNWYKYDPLENNPVGEMEINEKKIDDNEKEKNKEKIEYEEEEEDDDDDEENDDDDETDNDLQKDSQSLTDDGNKKKNGIDSPERIEVNNNNKTVKNNFIDNKYTPSESGDSEDDFKLKMMQKLNKNDDDKNGS